MPVSYLFCLKKCIKNHIHLFQMKRCESQYIMLIIQYAIVVTCKDVMLARLGFRERTKNIYTHYPFNICTPQRKYLPTYISLDISQKHPISRRSYIKKIQV